MNPKEYWGTEKRVLLIDLDGTLCEDNTFPNYLTAKPFSSQIKALHELKGRYYIVIWTARYEADRSVTEKWLKDNDVPYDRLIFGKLPYHFFIDWNSSKSVLELLALVVSDQERNCK